MELPIATKPALWGIAGGAVAMAIVGFTWGGWVTGSKAEAAASLRANAAVVAALAPVCAQNFKGAGGASDSLAALNKLDSWAQGEFIEKGGWAKVAGSNPPDQVSAVARACALLLAGT